MKTINRQLICAFGANTDWALFNFRRGLIKEVQGQGVKVACICSDTGFWNHLNTLNLNHLIRLKQYVKQINPIKDIKLFLEYLQLYRRLKPEIVHHFTIKPVIYGSLAAIIAKVPIIINTITGLGYVFTDGEANRLLLRWLTCGLYKLSAYGSDYFWFQNEQDKDYFIRHNILNEDKCGVIFGSGVDLKYFSADNVSFQEKQTLRKELKLIKNDIIVLMIARMLYDKGIQEFITAA